jgi:pyocin large subunit-like protein
MSHSATNWAWQQDIPSSQKFVLVALADMADSQESCYPGQERIAQMTNVSLDTVQRAITALEKLGLLSRTARRNETGYRTSDRYQLHV